MREKLFHRDFTLVVIGQIISLLGNAVLRFVLPLYLLDVTGSRSLFGLCSAAAFVPMVVLTPLGGVVADRLHKQRIMVVLDFFTAMIFASTLGAAICAIPIPQVIILFIVFGAGKLLAGVLTPAMFADLSACGGILTMAAGFRVSKIKSVPLVDLMPALILVMPFSLLWTTLMG